MKMSPSLTKVGSKATDLLKKKNGMEQDNVNFQTNIEKPYMDGSTGKPLYQVEQNGEDATGALWHGQDGTSQTSKTFTNLSGLALLGGTAANSFRNMQSEKDQIEEYRNKEQQAMTKGAYDTLNTSKTMSGQVGQNIMNQANVAGRNAQTAGLAKMHNTGGEGNMAAIAGASKDQVYSQGALQGSGMQSQILAQGNDSFATQMGNAESRVQNLYKGDDPYAAAVSGAANVPYALNEASKLGLESIQNRDLTLNARKLNKPINSKPMDMTKAPSATATAPAEPSLEQSRELPGTGTVSRIAESSNTQEMLGLSPTQQPQEDKPFFQMGGTPVMPGNILNGKSLYELGTNGLMGIGKKIKEGRANSVNKFNNQYAIRP